MNPHDLIVGGEHFRVARRTNAPAVYDFTWLSGPHDPSYGFSKGTGSEIDLTEDQMRSAIAEFLANINPETGYL